MGIVRGVRGVRGSAYTKKPASRVRKTGCSQLEFQTANTAHTTNNAGGCWANRVPDAVGDPETANSRFFIACLHLFPLRWPDCP